MKYEFISQHRFAFGVEKMCRALKVSRSGYYTWADRGPSRREQANQQLWVKIKRSYAESQQRYGSPRITIDLRR